MPVVERVRLSIGTAIEFGLETGTSDPYFTTAFLMTYRVGKCESNCAFCPQARDSSSASDRLSRISWPDYDVDEVMSSWPESSQFRRICIQTLCYASVVVEVIDIVRRLREVTELPISVAIHPVSKIDLSRMKAAGVMNIGIALDASTDSLFEEIKGKGRATAYRWDRHISALREALGVFGKGNVTTHLIVGLGETEREAADFISLMYSMGISVGLFAFTSIKGTSLEGAEPPSLSSYRRIQVVRHLASKGVISSKQIGVDDNGRLTIAIPNKSILAALSSGEAFQVTGCEGCNRPYYNEKPQGPMYNYPRPLDKKEILAAIRETQLV